jgi:hypothetical protein
MNEWLKDAPALLYVDNTWLVVNKWCEPLSWTEDPAEAAWVVRCVLDKQIKAETTQQEQKPALKVLRGRKNSRVSSRASSPVSQIKLPSRRLP